MKFILQARPTFLLRWATHCYQFDGNTAGGLGQRTALNLNTGSSGASTSTYGAFAQLNQVATTGPLTTSLGSPVNDTYDAVGQLTTHDPGENTDALTWDAFGRLVAVQRTGTSGFTWQAAYDGFGRRLQTKTVASGTGTTVLPQSSYDPEVQFLELPDQLSLYYPNALVGVISPSAFPLLNLGNIGIMQ